MQKIYNFDWAIGMSRSGLVAFGIWPGIVGGKQNKDFRPLWMTVIMMAGIFCPQMYAMSRIINDLPLVLDNIMTSSSITLCFIKILIFWKNEHELQSVVESMEADWNQPRIDYEHKIMMREGRRGRSLTIYCYILMTVAMCGLNIFPFFGLSFRNLSNLTDFEGFLFPVQSYYPYEFTNWPKYGITYLTQTMCCLYFGYGFTVIDSFFAVLIFHMCGQLEIFGMRLQNFSLSQWDRSVVGKNMNNGYRKWLKDVIDTQVHYTWVVSKIENTYNMICFLQLIFISVIIGSIGIQVLNVFQNDTGAQTSSLQLLFRVGTLFDAILHVFIYCFAGEQLAKNSENLALCMYSCKWYLFPREIRTDILLIIQRSNDPIRITAGKFLFLSFGSFTKILNTSAGYISMIIAVSTD